MNVEVAPFTPAGRPAQSDSEWVRDCGRRHRAARLRQYNLNLPDQVTGQTAGLTRAVQAISATAHRRMMGRVRVNQMLADATLENDVERYRRDRREALEVSERAQARSRGAVISRSAGRSTEHTANCWVCAEGRKGDAAKRNPGPDITRARRLENLGYGESSPGGCPPCSACHYVACRCGQPGLRQYPGGRAAAVYA